MNGNTNGHMVIKTSPSHRRVVIGLYNLAKKKQWILASYPLVIEHNYGQPPFIVNFPMKNGDFPYTY